VNPEAPTPSAPAKTLDYSTPLSPPSSAPANGGTLWGRIWRWTRENTFLPAWLPEPLQHPLAGLALAALLEVCAGLVTLLLIAVVPSFAFLGTVHLLVVALIALTWGAAPSLLAAVVGAISLEFFVLPDVAGGDMALPTNLVETFIFLLICGIIGVLSSSTERARRHAVDAYAASQARLLALRETNARTDEFLSIASHELRSPLTSLKAALQLGKRRVRRIGEQEQPIADLLSQLDVVQGLLSTAEQQVDRQDRLVGDLLDVSRIRVGKLEYQLEPCDLAAIVSDAVDEQRLSWPDRVITLDVPTGAVTITGDAHRIGQVVTNYLTNALKYSPPGAPVAVSLRVERDHARVAVRDQGPGLTAQQSEHIWDRFHRVPGIRQQSGSGAGLGLGLHIVGAIVEHHGGEVGVESAPKRGSTFWFTIPLPLAAHAES
jgi:signal transduction histidine kinase